MNTNVMFSSASNEWATPQELFDKLDAVHHFTLDPASTEENAKCKKHYTEKDDGLSKNWGGGNSVLQPSVWKSASAMGQESL